MRPLVGLPFDGRLVADLESPGLAGEAVQAASGLVDDLGRRVHALALREGQFLAHDGHVLGRRDLEDEVDGRPQIRGPVRRSRRVAPKYPRTPDRVLRTRRESRRRDFARDQFRRRDHAVRAAVCAGADRDSSTRIRRTADLRLPSRRDRARDRARERSRVARGGFWPLAVAALAIAAVCAVAAVRPWAAPPSAVVATAQDAAPAAVAPAAARSARAAARADLRRLVDVRLGRVPARRSDTPTCSASVSAGRRRSTACAAAATSSPGSTAARTASASPPSIPALDPDLVIVEGSINDRRLPADGIPGGRDRGVGRAGRALPRGVHRHPRPGAAGAAGQAATARIDADLAELAAARGWWYVSPIAEDWITPDNYAEVIDTGIGRDHPSTDGHAYLATRLAEALATLSEGTGCRRRCAARRGAVRPLTRTDRRRAR